MESKARKIPSSKAELRRLLKRSKSKYLYAITLGMGTEVTIYTSDCSNNDALWAMPLSDIAKSKRSKGK